MKLLKINNNEGLFLDAAGSYVAIDKIAKEDLLRLVGYILDDENSDFDEFDTELIKNLSHQVIYKSLANKLNDLQERRTEFKDESARLFLEDYEKYRE